MVYILVHHGAVTRDNMSRIFEKYPSATPWIAGSISAALMLLTSFVEERSYLARGLESLIVGVVVALTVRALRKRPNSGQESR